MQTQRSKGTGGLAGFHRFLKLPVINDLFIIPLCREGRGNAHLEGDYRKIGDVILKNFNQSTMDHYSRYIDTHPLVLDKLEQTLHKNAKFEQVYR